MVKLVDIPWMKGVAPRVAVIGDVILDEYLDGKVNRISPEAPVPVHLVHSSTITPGGAANVARNIKCAGGEVLLCGVSGKDETAEKLGRILRSEGIATEGIRTDPGRPTVRKTRISASKQQIVRIDWEKVQPIAEKFQTEILTYLRKNEMDAILISDYGKGTLPENFIANLIALAQKKGIPCIVDPKGKDFSKYKGATCITPNRKEAHEALGLSDATSIDPEEIGRKLQQKFDLDNILVTLGEDGMLFVPASAESKPILERARKREVFDVSGAGDTVISVLALCWASGCKIEQSLEIANLAGGIVVEKWGTQPIRLKEIEAALMGSVSASGCSSALKLKSRNELKEECAILKSKNLKVVFTNGCFDILHAGHLQYLEAAKEKGDILVVGINGDESIRRLKGPLRPINPLEQRMRLLAGLACVDYVVDFHEETPMALIEALMPDVLVKGADWKAEEIVGGQLVKENGGLVLTLPLLSGVSTSKIVEKVLNKNS